MSNVAVERSGSTTRAAIVPKWLRFGLVGLGFVYVLILLAGAFYFRHFPSRLLLIVTPLVAGTAVAAVLIWLVTRWFVKGNGRSRYDSRFLIALVSYSLIVAGTWGGWNYIVDRKIQDEFRRIGAAGEPLSFADLKAKATSDLAEDAGRHYAAAISLVAGITVDSIKELRSAYEQSLARRPPDPVDDEIRGKAAELLAAHRQLFEMLDRGADVDACTFDTGMSLGLESFFARQSAIRKVVLLQSLRTLVEMSEGNPNAGHAIFALLRFFRVADDRCLMFAQSSSAEYKAIAAADVVTLLQASSPADALLAQLAECLHDADRMPDLAKGLAVERVVALEGMRFSFDPPDLLGGRRLTYPTTTPPRKP